MNLPNEAQAEEEGEGRTSPKGNPSQQSADRAQDRTPSADPALERIRTAARRDRTTKFTALLHHVTVERLEQAFDELNRKASPGVDGVTWPEYDADRSSNLKDLYARIQQGGYQPTPSKRARIPKPDGGLRPLGIAALEDKIVQRAVASVLGAVYEETFCGFSYGFRPDRSAHDALDAFGYCIIRKNVNWVLDADICGFFDAIPHDRLMQLVEHRIGDPRVLRLLRRWLRSGVLEDGTLTRTETGSPQGASISPLLANVYLHYVFDRWAHVWRHTNARGDVCIVRYADDFVVGFQYREEAERFLTELRAQFAENGLELHPDKTRLIEFGRHARTARKRRGEGKPETFDFLGFTHICAVNRKGWFLLRRHTIARRFTRKLRELKATIMRRRHWPIRELGGWLRAVMRGYFNYFAVPTNLHRLRAMRREVANFWLRALRRRGQRDRTTWLRFAALCDPWLPVPRCVHPFPEQRPPARLTQGRSRMR